MQHAETTARRRKPRQSRLAVARALVALTASTMAVVSAPAPAAATEVMCYTASVPVTLEGGSGPITGTLCIPDEATTVQVLVHGFTWGNYYWDLPYQAGRYSTRLQANERGYATFNIDRLGVAPSYQPASSLVTFENNASALHQVVQWLRRGEPQRLGFTKVVLVGQSYGALTSWLEAGRYRDVDAVVTTGVTHLPNWEALAAEQPNFWPAALDPKFAGSGLDQGYLTTIPGARSIYYVMGNVDPTVVALDERFKQTGTIQERQTVLPELLLAASQNINVPVYVITGAQEPFFCNGPGAADCSSSSVLEAGERPFFGAGASVEALVVPNAGHNVTLQLNGPQTIIAIQNWITRHVG